MFQKSKISLAFLLISAFIEFEFSPVVAQEPHASLPVININNCCASQIKNSNCGEDYEALRNNISATLDEYKQRMESILRTLTTKTNNRDCQDIQLLGHHDTGIYKVKPDGNIGEFPVRCDMDTAGGGWTVIQRRVSDSNFYRNWTDYQIGFGNLSENFWIGNQQLHMITVQGWYELRVDLTGMDDIVAYAKYNVFSVGNADSGYKLTVDGYSGNAGDSLGYHNGQKFSTSDRDNDNYSKNCANIYTGPWWHGSCHNSNLNGAYGAKGGKGPVWETFKGNDGPMKKTEMKIRRWKRQE